jgi:dUTP pyrophosphatase
MSILDRPRLYNTNLSLGSHIKVWTHCDFGFSPGCENVWEKEYRVVIRDRKKNNDKDICLQCSRHIKSNGRNNPNCKHKELQDNWFADINSEIKAYVLGLITSDGSLKQDGTISISLKLSDKEFLERVAKQLCPTLEVKKTKDDKMAVLIFCSKQMVSDACRHLGINPGKKSHTVKFPKLSEKLVRHFVRGLFDGDGSIRSLKTESGYASSPECKITSSSDEMRSSLMTLGFPAREYKTDVSWQGVNALDFLGWIYEESFIYMSRKRDQYLDWCCWVPILGGIGNSGRNKSFTWYRTREDAVAPIKSRVSDSGYDLTILEKVKSYGPIELYDTGIRISVPYGIYMDLVPRSSIIKQGYILANSVGVIDRSYRGNIMVPLIKIDSSAQELRCPNRIVQLIPRPIFHMQVVEVEDIEETERGDNGFGSSGQ